MPHKKIITALETGNYRKIICGAANTSEQQVERLAFVYALAGADVLDIAPMDKIHKAAQKGISKAQEYKPDVFPPVIMTSINVGDDQHFRKASFNLAKCIECLECAKVCDIKNDPEKCYGCAQCVEACQHNAITLVKIPHEHKIKHYSAMELHTGVSSIEEVKAFVELNRSAIEHADLLSVSINSTRFNNADLIRYANSIISLFNKKIIIQIDGLSMKGGGKKTSTLQTLAAASRLIDAEVKAYIQLSGGTNYLTQQIVDLTGLHISGIGYGTFAKKIILSYIEDSDEDRFMRNIHKIVDVASNLIKN